MSTDFLHSPATFSQTLEALRDAYAQMEARYEQIAAAKEMVEFSPIVVSVDEVLEELPPLDRKVSTEVLAAISSIARKGRSANLVVLSLTAGVRTSEEMLNAWPELRY